MQTSRSNLPKQSGAWPACTALRSVVRKARCSSDSRPTSGASFRCHGWRARGRCWRAGIRSIGRVPGSKSVVRVNDMSMANFVRYVIPTFHLDIPDLIELYQDRMVQTIQPHTINSAEYHTHGVPFDAALKIIGST